MRELRTDKNTRILTLYHSLMTGQHINKNFFCQEHQINPRTFDRDIEDIRLFLSEIFSPNSIEYCREERSYYMTGNHLKQMDKLEAIVLAKSILSSKAFREDEIDGILQELLSVVSIHDKEILLDYIRGDWKHYSTEIQKPVVKILVDLYKIISHDNDIILNSSNNKYDKLKVMPMEVIFQKNKYLLIAKEMTHRKIIEIPIDEIESFGISKTNFSRTEKKLYYEAKLYL